MKLPFICQQPFCNKEDRKFSCYLGSSYRINKSKQTFKNAVKTCADDGGSIVVFNNASFHSFVFGLLQEKNDSRINLIKMLKFVFQSPLPTRNLVEHFSQFLMVHCQLIIIIGLSMDNGDSLTSKILRTRVMQFLGRISLSLYLLQLPLLGYIKLMMNQAWQYYNMAEMSSTSLEEWRDFWSPPILIVISPIVAFVTTRYFEEPITNILRKKTWRLPIGTL